MEKNKKKNICKWLSIFSMMLILLFSVSVSAEMFSAGLNVGMKETKTLPANNQVVTLVFKDQTGKIYSELQKNINMGAMITLPNVPGRENAVGSGWKVEPNVADDTVKKWEAGAALTILNSDIYLGNKIVNNVLTFYAIPGIDPCVVKYYTGDGSKLLQQVEVKYGSNIVFPDFPEDGYKNQGWALNAKAQTASYQIGSNYQIKNNVNFYLVRTEMVDAVFKSKNGKTNSFYRGIGKTVEKGTTIIMPELKPTVGYESLGWSTKISPTTAEYTVGQTVVLKEDTTFYAAYKYVGKRTVKFTSNSGKSTSKKFTSLNTTVTRFSYFTVPAVPKVSGYQALGWTTVKNGKTVKYKPGDIIKVSKNITFYGVYQKTCKVYLRTKGGKLWKTVEVAKGSYYELPGVRNKNGYTMMGWSTKKGQSKNAKYEVGEKVKVSKNITLYSVLFVRSKETDYSGLQLQKITAGLTSKYKQVIFVGDSRTVLMERTLVKCGYTASTDKVSFIAKKGEGLAWLKETGYNQLLNKVGNKNSLNEKPTAVIFNLGVNDLGNLSKYVSYMKQIAPELEKRGCKLYYMSVNPVNNESLKYWGKKERAEAKVRNFNTTIKSKLCGKNGDYTFINSYAYLMKYGFGTNAGNAGYDVEKDDGLHYTVKTYKRIFRYCINILKK